MSATQRLQSAQTSTIAPIQRQRETSSQIKGGRCNGEIDADESLPGRAGHISNCRGLIAVIFSHDKLDGRVAQGIVPLKSAET